MDVIKWARSEGCPWNECVCEGAAMDGNLTNLKWLRENGCPWDEGVTANAAEHGHFTLLKWSVENWCDIDYDTCRYLADENEHYSILGWLVCDADEYM